MRKHKLHLADGIPLLLAHILAEFSPESPPALETQSERDTAYFTVVRCQKHDLQISRFTSFIIHPDLYTAMLASGGIKHSGGILKKNLSSRLPCNPQGRLAELIPIRGESYTGFALCAFPCSKGRHVFK